MHSPCTGQISCNFKAWDKLVMQCFLMGYGGKARVSPKKENTSYTWHIPQYPNRNHCITNIHLM